MCKKIIQFGEKVEKCSTSSTISDTRNDLNDYLSDINVEKLIQWIKKVQDNYTYGAIKQLSETVVFSKCSFDHVKFIEADADNNSDTIVFSSNTIGMGNITILTDHICKISSSPNKEDPKWCDISIIMTDSIKISIELYYSGN